MHYFIFENANQYVLFFSIYVLSFSTFTGCSSLDQYDIHHITPDQHLLQGYSNKIAHLDKKKAAAVFAKDEIEMVKRVNKTLLTQRGGNARTAQIAIAKNLKEMKLLLERIDLQKVSFFKTIQEKCQKIDPQITELFSLNLNSDRMSPFEQANDICKLFLKDEPSAPGAFTYPEIKKNIDFASRMVGETIREMRKKILYKIKSLLQLLKNEISKDSLFYSRIPLVKNNNCLKELKKARNILTDTKTPHTQRKNTELNRKLTEAKLYVKNVAKAVVHLAKEKADHVKKIKLGNTSGSIEGYRDFFHKESQYLEKYLKKGYFEKDENIGDTLKRAKKVVKKADEIIKIRPDDIMKEIHIVDSAINSIKQHKISSKQLTTAIDNYNEARTALNLADINHAITRTTEAKKIINEIIDQYVQPIYLSEQHLSNLSDAFDKLEVQTFKDHIQRIKTTRENDQLTLTIHEAVQYKKAFENGTSPIFEQLDYRFDQLKVIIQKVLFLISDKKTRTISTLYKNIQNLYRSMGTSNIFQKFTDYKQINVNLNKLSKRLDIKPKPTHALLILEAADHSRRPNAFLDARSAVISYLNEKEQKGINNELLVDVALGYNDKVYKQEPEEIQEALPNPQASTSLDKQLEHAITLFKPSYAIKKIIYLIPSTRRTIINDNLISQVNIQDFEKNKISFNCLFLGDSDISVLTNLSKQTNGGTHKCQSKEKIKEKIAKLLKQ